MSADFFEGVKPWSYYKHEILKKYLRVWANKLGRYHRDLYFVDTHAGAGAYDTGEPGSPLLALQLNDDAGIRRSGARITVVACEADETNYQKLRTSLRPWLAGNAPRAITLQGTFAIYLETIVEFTWAQPTLYFLDSFGMADLSLDALFPILEARERRKEIVLRLDHTMFARWAGWLEERPRSERATRTAARFAKLVEEFRVDSIGAKSLKSEGHPDASHALMRGYVEAFMERFTWVNLIPIRASFDGAPRYYLLHATDSDHGCALMNDVVSTTRDQLFQRTEESKRTGSSQGDFFAPADLPTPGTSSPLALDRCIQRILSEAGPQQWITVRAELSATLGPEFRDKHHKASLRRLMNDARVTCASGALITDASVLALP